MTATVLAVGALATVQDWPGRLGYWQVGLPPSGPMDDLSFRLANVCVGNPEGAPGVEITLGGITIRFDADATVAVTGAPVPVDVDGLPAPQWCPIAVRAGQTLRIGAVAGPGMRSYLAIAGGLAGETYLGSVATFMLAALGAGALRTGDEISWGDAGSGKPRRILADEQPSIGTRWELAVAEGPHAAPEFLTDVDMATVYASEYRVHFNSDRTGVRLEGPKPRWARPDGGEAGLHPSNIHDTPYSVGALDFTGDTPILLGPDGPSLGGFVCPVTVVSGDRWKLGQLGPGDAVRFVPVRTSASPSLAALGSARRGALGYVPRGRADSDGGVLGRGTTADGATSLTYRRSGDDNVLVEYGPMALDLALRARVHALQHALRGAAGPAVVDLTPGIRSLQVKFDPRRTSTRAVVDLLREVEAQLPPAAELNVPSRTVRLPLSWDDPSTREAIQRYMHGVRADAPWCPWNIEFIRRMNGLESVDDVQRIVFDASYLVLGLGDVYLGAPVATPLDPRHRLVTTKYNPARTWTPENAVGIGGAYLCVYGMEGPGGYQFVGRTTQVWNHRHPLGADGFEPDSPWLLRFFDRISWYPVSSAELADLRADMAAGRGNVDISDGTFSLADHDAFLACEAADIAAVRGRMEEARAEERRRWSLVGEVA
ncbi:5-oxoprolinase/urea amidolyase family protein [Tsukamurella soli]|uniref:5-oxoprolinase/urea amidolyase family protein n=1 Tax=Tsukamurella soli TaxID=644556 RepID=A0ABP8JDC2_9ACTN